MNINDKITKTLADEMAKSIDAEIIRIIIEKAKKI